MFKKLGVLLCLFSLTLVLGACSNANGSTYDNIKKSKEMTFAMTGQYPPFNFINEEGELAGFDIDIANAIAEEMGVEAKPITTAWDGIIGGLKGQRFDMIIGSMAITDKRLEEVNFTTPYYYDGAQLFALPESEYASIEDLTESKVGVVTGTTFQEFLNEHYPDMEILQFESDVDNMKAIEQNRIDGLVTGKFVGLQGKEKYGVNIEPIGELLYAEKIGIALRKEDEKLLEAVNAALQAIVDNGTYEEISNKWFGMNILEK